jgi:FkbM family methyltransferase
LTIKTIFSGTAYLAIKHGLRLPRAYKLDAFRQHTRTIDEIERRGINVVLDVGANRGFYSEHLRAIGYEGLILAFEPVRECFDELSQRAAEDPKWRVFNCALGEDAGEIEFNIVWVGDHEAVLSSVLTPKMDLPTKKVVVPVRTVRDVLDSEVSLAHPRAFLKMDTQGYDLRVFAGAQNAAEIDLLLSEVSAVESYVGMPHYTNALRCYEEAGFELLDMFVLGQTASGSIGEFDVLLGRRTRDGVSFPHGA